MSIQSQARKFSATVLENLPDVDDLQYWIENPEEVRKALKQVFCRPKAESSEVSNISLFQAYDLLGLKAEYEEAKEKFDLTEDPSLWKLVMVKGLTCNALVQGYKKVGVKMYLYTRDLDKDVKENQRNPNQDGSYLVCFRRRVEADKENRNQSTNQRKEQNCQDITLMERLLLGLAYQLATGGHLDEENVTQCAGSRGSSGDVPRVDWSPDDREVYVDWYDPGDAGDDLRARSVVSCHPELLASQSEQA